MMRDSVSVPNPDVSLLGANPSGYRYLSFVNETQNYSGNSTVYFLFVQKLTSQVHLFLNGVESHLNLSYGVLSNASAWSVNGTPVS